MQLKEIKNGMLKSLILCVAYGYKENQLIKVVYEIYKFYNFDICYAPIVQVNVPVTQN